MCEFENENAGKLIYTKITQPQVVWILSENVKTLGVFVMWGQFQPRIRPLNLSHTGSESILKCIDNYFHKILAFPLKMYD